MVFIQLQKVVTCFAMVLVHQLSTAKTKKQNKYKTRDREKQFVCQDSVHVIFTEQYIFRQPDEFMFLYNKISAIILFYQYLRSS